MIEDNSGCTGRGGEMEGRGIHPVTYFLYLGSAL